MADDHEGDEGAATTREPAAESEQSSPGDAAGAPVTAEQAAAETSETKPSITRGGGERGVHQPDHDDTAG